MPSNRHAATSSTEVPLKLLEAAKAVAANAYAPYSGFAVGAAAETADGRIFVGANMENASYGVTVCAEIGALQGAASSGALGSLRRIAIVGGPIKPGRHHQAQTTPPCGRCRQLIAEAGMVAACDIEVWFADLNLECVEKRTISQLLPDSFDALNLD